MARAEVHRLMERMAIPAIAAPMFLVSNPALTLACCSEGIMGSFPAHGTRRATGGMPAVGVTPNAAILIPSPGRIIARDR